MAGRGRMDSEECKMFVGGLTKDTTADMLKGYFSYYGRITHAVVMTNPETQKSRGFGFVAFERPEIVDRVIMSGPHFLDGKQIDPKPSVPKDLRPKPPQVEQPKKAFLGGLPLEMNETDLREFFSSYGVVTECYIMFDEKRMKSRGFGFVSFEDDSIVDDLVSQHYIDVRNKRVEVKLARPRENPLAPLNSEGRVLSAEAHQHRVAAAAAASVHAHPPPFAYNEYDYYPPPHGMRNYYGGPYGSGPPAPKRLRIGARTPPPYSPPPPSDYYQRDHYAGYDDGDQPSYGDRSISARPGSSKGARESVKDSPASTVPSAAGASSIPASLLPFVQGGTGAAIDVSNMTPETMTTMMQQAMQNMGGVGMNMMMPMLMSNMMTQVFMNQAQNMFQTISQQRKSDGSASASGTDGQPANQSEVMDMMKNALQSMMTAMQQQQQQQQQQEQDQKPSKTDK